MQRFLGERIDVQRAESSPRPVHFQWQGKAHEVVEVLKERVDAGYGDLPPRSRRWYTRRHRRYFTVRDTDGAVFEMYLDYGNRNRQSWWLVSRWEPSEY